MALLLADINLQQFGFGFSLGLIVGELFVFVSLYMLIGFPFCFYLIWPKFRWRHVKNSRNAMR